MPGRVFGYHHITNITNDLVLGWSKTVSGIRQHFNYFVTLTERLCGAHFISSPERNVKICCNPISSVVFPLFALFMTVPFSDN